MRRRAAAVVLSCVALMGCPGEYALDEESPIVLVIRTPEDAGDEILMGERDAEALGLEQRSFPTADGPGYNSTWITTSLLQSANGGDEHCLHEPITVRGNGVERLLIERGECFGASGSLMDRAAIQIVAPRQHSDVGSSVTVEVDNQVSAGDLSLHALVNGEELATASGESPTIALDLTDVSPGPATLRVEARATSGRIAAADVVEIVIATEP